MIPSKLIDLRADGKMWGQISHDGRRLVFRRRGMVVEFDVEATLQQGRAVKTHDEVLKQAF